MRETDVFGKSDIRDFFDAYASTWDQNMIRDDNIIKTILDNAHVQQGFKILDVACGTGVLIPDYLSRGVAGVTAVDISPEMIAHAQKKFPQECIQFICGDAEEDDVGSNFDCVIIYNALPHFPDPEKLIQRLSSLLKPNGTLTVAHGMSREKINAHHSGSARKISLGLMPAEQLVDIFNRYLQVTIVISDDKMYQVVGKRV